MLSVELSFLADILEAAGQSKNVSDLAREWSGIIKNAVMNTTVRHSSAHCVTIKLTPR
jgi:hypothetical protein